MTGKELEQIYNEAYRAVYWTAMSLLKNEADAEDIVQDTFVAFIESYSDIKDTTKAAALLKKIAANKCLNRIKFAKTDTVEDEFFDNVEAVPEDFLPDTIVESEAARKVVMDIINNSLSDDVRRTLILFYFDEMSTKEIAEALGVPQGTVLRRLNYARNKIKKEVEKYEKENDTKLFGMAIPFLTKLFIKESEQVAFKPMPAKLANLSASVKASGKGVNINASTGAIKKGTDIMKLKILIGSIAAVLAVGVTVGIIIVAINNTGNSLGGTLSSDAIEKLADGSEENGHSSREADATASDATTSEAASSETVEFNEEISISVEDMSADEIIADLESMRTITSTSMADYQSRFTLEPTSDGVDNYDFYYWWQTNSADYIDNPEDKPKTYLNMDAYVELLEISGIEFTSDGEFTVKENGGWLSVSLNFTDLDTAKAVYDAVIATYFNEDGFNEIVDETGWCASCNGNDVRRGANCYLIVSGFDGPLEVYSLDITIPLVDMTN